MASLVSLCRLPQILNQFDLNFWCHLKVRMPTRKRISRTTTELFQYPILFTYFGVLNLESFFDPGKFRLQSVDIYFVFHTKIKTITKTAAMVIAIITSCVRVRHATTTGFDRAENWFGVCAN